MSALPETPCRRGAVTTAEASLRTARQPALCAALEVMMSPLGSMSSGGGTPCSLRYRILRQSLIFGPWQYLETNPRQARSSVLPYFLKNPQFPSISHSVRIGYLPCPGTPGTAQGRAIAPIQQSS
jgi:hypothetical protein